MTDIPDAPASCDIDCCDAGLPHVETAEFAGIGTT